jgi:hypothetical protein
MADEWRDAVLNGFSLLQGVSCFLVASRSAGPVARKFPNTQTNANTAEHSASFIGPKFLISTNGSIYEHPDDVAIARIICSGTKPKEIIFNYRTDQTSNWENERWQEEHGCRAIYPKELENGSIVVSL